MNILLRSLQIKIIILIALVVGPILLTFSYINLKLLETRSIKQIENSARLLAQGIDAFIESRKRMEDPATLNIEMSSITNLKLGVNEIHIFVFEESGKKKETQKVRYLIDTPSDAKPFQLPPEIMRILQANRIPQAQIKQEQSEKRYMEVIVPFHQLKKVRGGIAIRSSLEELDQLIAERQSRNTKTTIMSIAILVVVLGLIMHLMVTRPVQKLVGGMQKVESGNLKEKISSRRKDELGRLTSQFNQMVGRLAETSSKNEELMKQVEMFNKELQSKIEETTAELMLRNQELSVANERLINLQRRLWEMERLATLGQVAATIAHEIGTPLGAISGHIQLLKSNDTENADTQRRLDLIDKQIGRVVNTVQKMLDSVKLRKPETQSVNIHEVLDNVLFLLSPQFKNGNVKLEMNIPSNIPSIKMNIDELHQILLNLLTNSIDAMPEGGSILISSELITTQDMYFPEMVVIRVKDSGFGIPADDLSKIFDPFFTTKSAGKGTGLGLAVCKDIIERYNGRISVKSEPNAGTLFELQFPVESKSNG